MRILKIKDWKKHKDLENNQRLNRHNIVSWVNGFQFEFFEKRGFYTAHEPDVHYWLGEFLGLTPYEAYCKYTGESDEYEW